MSTFLPFFISVFLSWLVTLSGEEPLFQEAVNRYDSGLFEKAEPLFEEFASISHPHSKEEAEAKLYLVKCNYLLQRHEKIARLLSDQFHRPIEQSLLPFYQESLFFWGLSLKAQGKYESALACFFQNLQLFSEYEENALSLNALYNQLNYEIGSLYFQMKQFDLAKKYFHQLPQDFLNDMRDVRLAQIAIYEKDDKELESKIQDLANISANKKQTPFMIAFLKGEAFFAKKDWKNSVSYFRTAIPSNNATCAKWLEEAYLYLAISLLHLFEEDYILNNRLIFRSLLSNTTFSSEKKPKDFQESIKYLNESEQVLKKLLKIVFNEQAYLALGQCYLYRGLYLKENDAFETLLKHLAKSKTLLLKENQYHAALLHAQAVEDYEEKKTLFKQLLQYDSQIESYTLYPYVWYFYGLNEYQKALKVEPISQNPEILDHLEESLDAFKKAFQSAHPKQPQLAAQILQAEAQATLCLNTQTGYKKALTFLNKISTNSEINLVPEKEPIEFFKALFQAKLAQITHEPLFFEQAEEGLQKFTEKRSNYEDAAKLLLGSLYYLQGKYAKAESLFSELAHQYPPSSCADEALLLASNSAELQGKDKESKNYRKKLHELYPASPFAAEAFFRLYSYKEYLNLKGPSIDHLAKLERDYPNSPYALNALYLKAVYSIKNENKEQAFDAFEKLHGLFERLVQQNRIEEASFPYFLALYHRALLEQSKMIMSIHSNDRMEIAEKNLQQVLAYFKDSGQESQNFLKEESENQLIKCYMMQEKEEAALALIEKVIEQYRESRTTRGEYLSKALFERGKLLAKQKLYPLSIESFEEAGEAAKGKILQPDDLLDIWIEQALSLKEMEKFEDAMLLLSRVINYSAVSSRRLKAMYLRAILYEGQGRQELARRQLESLAQQNGDWAIKAKEKLENTYVYH